MPASPGHLCHLLAAIAPATVAAQTYPTKPVTLIVPWPAGGSTDIAMRAIAEAATKHLGQTIVIDNKPGASGTLGPAVMAANAKPDGYTIAQMPITVMRLPLMQKTAWDALKDFTYIVHLTGYTFGITTKADGPFKTWADVVAYAKANPGKVTYATPGAGTSLHIGMEQIAARSGIQLTHVPFKGGAETNAAVLGGHTTLQADCTRLEAAGRRRPAAAARDLDGPSAARTGPMRRRSRSSATPSCSTRPSASPAPRAWTRPSCRSCTTPSRRRSRTRRSCDLGQVRHGAPLYRHGRLPQVRRGDHRQREGRAREDRPRQEGLGHESQQAPSRDRHRARPSVQQGPTRVTETTRRREEDDASS